MDEEELDKVYVAEAMRRYGGSFVVALASCVDHADHINLEKIKRAFPEYWQTYMDFAIKDYVANNSSKK